MTPKLLSLPIAMLAVSAPAFAAQTGTPPASAMTTADTIAELQRQIDELKATVQQLKAAQDASAKASAPPVAPATPATATATAAPTATPPATDTAAPATATATAAGVAPAAAAKPAAPAAQTASADKIVKSKQWYERLSLRGYVQMRYNAELSGDLTAPAGESRLRSIQDAALGENTSFSFRRVRLILSGNITDNLFLYIQPDFATAVSNQTAGETREGFAQLRDAYLDVFTSDSHKLKIRFGQSKVPYGWENLQSSSNRIALDRTDAINTATPGERDIGIVAYYTPSQVQAVWDELAKEGQKLFGNYGAFGLGVFNGQGTNRTERNSSMMVVGMATWPLRLDGLGDWADGQVLELGGSFMINQYRPEVRVGGVAAQSYDDNRINLHAILYPRPFGLQAEWNWGEGPEWDSVTRRIETKPLSGGYVQAMYWVKKSPIGQIIPYVRWQTYRGGFKAGTNAPRLETDEIEGGFEITPIKPLEFTLAFSRMQRREADERRSGQAEGNVLRAQLQWTY
jgi:hypothetical protein